MAGVPGPRRKAIAVGLFLKRAKAQEGKFKKGGGNWDQGKEMKRSSWRSK